eukprot:scaffold211572_cov15-Tisochrysis_lutea.AAC.1
MVVVLQNRADGNRGRQGTRQENRGPGFSLDEIKAINKVCGCGRSELLARLHEHTVTELLSQCMDWVHVFLPKAGMSQGHSILWLGFELFALCASLYTLCPERRAFCVPTGGTDFRAFEFE